MYNQGKPTYPGTENRFGYGVSKAQTKVEPSAGQYTEAKSYIGFNPIGGSSNVSSLHMEDYKAGGESHSVGYFNTKAEGSTSTVSYLQKPTYFNSIYNPISLNSSESAYTRTSDLYPMTRSNISSIYSEPMSYQIYSREQRQSENGADINQIGYSYLSKDFEQPQPPPSISQYKGPPIPEKMYRGYEAKYSRVEPPTQVPSGEYTQPTTINRIVGPKIPSAAIAEQQTKVVTRNLYDNEEYDENVIYGRRKKQEDDLNINSNDQLFQPKMTFDERINDNAILPRESNQNNRPRRANPGRVQKANINIFKELETHEEEQISKFDKSPSPSARPDYPSNKGTFLSNNGMKKPRTLASVLEKQNKDPKISKVSEQDFNSSIKGSRLIKPTQIEKQRIEGNKGKVEPKSASKVNNYNQSLSQSQKSKDCPIKGIVGDTGSADTSAKSIKDRITGLAPTKGVKHAKFDLTDSVNTNNRTQTPKKPSARQHFVTTPSHKTNRLQPKSFGAAKKNSSTERKAENENSKLSMTSNKGVNSRIDSQRSPKRENKSMYENKTFKVESKLLSEKKSKEVPPKRVVAVKTLTLQVEKKQNSSKFVKKVLKFDPKKIDPQDGREQCSYCHRWFNNDRLEKHEDACYKTQNTKRKVFVSSQQRQVDTEQDYFKEISKYKYDKKEKKSAKESKWKEKSDAFRQAMKAAREGKAAPTVVDSSLIQCSFCGRRFNEKAAERHIPFCEKKSKETQMKITAKGRKK